MLSTFTWLDYSEQERRRALDVISLFKLQDTRDELGLASIRDAFAEQFFPGTTTIQTRARYFLLCALVVSGARKAARCEHPCAPTPSPVRRGADSPSDGQRGC